MIFSFLQQTETCWPNSDHGFGFCGSKYYRIWWSLDPRSGHFFL